MGSLIVIIESFNGVTGKETSDWTKDTSQELIDSRVPENNWIDGVQETIQALRNEGYHIGIVTSDTKKESINFWRKRKLEISLI